MLAPGEGETLRPGFEIKVALPELVVTEAVYAPGARGPDPHVHHDHADSFFVLEGQLEWRIGPDLEPRAGSAGSFVSVPPDVLHTFHNPGPGDTRFLNLHAPGLGFERYLRGDFPEFDQHYLPEGSGIDATDVVVLGPGEGERLQLGSSTATIKVGREQLRSSRPRSAPTSRTRRRTATPPRSRASTCWRASSACCSTARSRACRPDGCAAVPPGTVHTSPPRRAAARTLNVFAPGGIERYLREAVRLGGPPPPDEFDIEFV